MNDNSSPVRDGRSPLAETLMLLKHLQEAGMHVVPASPTRAMLQAGAEAGGIDPNTAARVFYAMLQAEDEAPKALNAEIIAG